MSDPHLDKNNAPERLWAWANAGWSVAGASVLNSANDGNSVMYIRADLIPATLEASENEAAEWKRQALYHNKKHGEMIEAYRQTQEVLRRAGRKLAAYAGVCPGDKELTETILPMVRAALTDMSSRLTPTEAPEHTDMMVTPESLDAWLEDNPLPAEPVSDVLREIIEWCHNQPGNYPDWMDRARAVVGEFNGDPGLSAADYEARVAGLREMIRDEIDMEYGDADQLARGLLAAGIGKVAK